MGSAQPEANDPIAAPHDHFVEALKAGSVKTLMSLQCEDATWMPPNETSLYGKGEVEEWFEEYFQHFRITSVTDTEREVQIHDDWAIEQCAYMVAIAPVKGGERIRDDSRTLIFWKREPDNQWRMSYVMFNSMRPIGSGTTRFLMRMMVQKGEEADPHRSESS
jgi:ketosteroid isomerase-like protein